VSAFLPSDDARVSSASPNSNYGSSNYLRLRQAAGDDHRNFLKFSVTGLSGTVTRAKIRLFAYDGSDDGGSAHAVGTGWAEASLTWNNAPALGSALGSAGNVPVNTWAEYDVTAAVTGNGSYAFAIVNGSIDSLYLRSKEYTSNKPELRIETTP